MSRCARTDALLQATFEGTDLTRAEAAHVAACHECARALSQARRFEAELGRVGLEVSAEPAPSATGHWAMDGSHMYGGRSVTARRGMISAVAGAVLIGAVLIGVRWLSGEGPAAGVGSGPPVVALSGALDDWLQDAEAATAASTDEPFVGDAPRVVRAEECGRDFAVVFEGDVSHEFYWVTGPREDGSQATAGVSRSLYSVEVARDRAAEDALCERIVEATISRADAAAAVERMGGIPGDARVLAASLLEPGTAMVVMEGSANLWSEDQWWVGLLHRVEGDWSGRSEEWIGTNTPEMAGGLKIITRNMIGPNQPNTDVVIVVLPGHARAVELDLDGVPHRFDASPGDGALIVALPSTIERPIPARFIGSDGEPFGGHVIRP